MMRWPTFRRSGIALLAGLMLLTTLGGVGAAELQSTEDTEIQFIGGDAEIDWDEEPPSEVTDNQIFTVTVSGELDDPGEVSLVEEDGLIDNTIKTVAVGSGSFEEEFRVNVAQDLEAENGEATHLYAEAEEDGLFGDADETAEVEVLITDVHTEVNWDERPPSQVGHDDRVSVSVWGEIEEPGEVVLIEDDGLIDNEIERQALTSGDFQEEFIIDVAQDIEADVGEATEVYAYLEADGLFGDDHETEPVEMVIGEAGQGTHVDWIERPPTQAAHGETFTASVAGEAEDGGELCLVEEGFLIDEEEFCLTVTTGAFEQSFEVNTESDLDAEPGEIAELNVELDDGFGSGDDAGTAEVAIEPMGTSVFWDQEPPESVDANGQFEVTVQGVMSEPGEIELAEESFFFDNTLETETLTSGSFSKTFTVDASELDADAGEVADLYVEVEEDGFLGDSDSTGSIEVLVE